MTELGPALHRWRDRITPAMVGLPDAQPRRAVGLRREELAQLAGVSVDYLTRLEQGRATRPSAQVVASLARALRLSPPERDHLFLLAGQAPPAAGLVPTYLPAGVQRLLDRLSDTPVSVYDAAWTQLTCSRRWAGLLGEPPGGTGRERNVVWRHFTGGPSRVSHTPEGETGFATAMVADLRTAAARYPDDAQLRSLVQVPRGASPRFADLWDRYVAAAHGSSRKTIHHPEVGPLTLDCDVLTVPGSDLRIVAYTAEPGSDAAERLALIAVLGTVPAILPGVSAGRRARLRPGGADPWLVTARSTTASLTDTGYVYVAHAAQGDGSLPVEPDVADRPIAQRSGVVIRSYGETIGT